MTSLSNASGTVESVQRIPSDTTLSSTCWNALLQALLSQTLPNGKQLFSPFLTKIPARSQVIAAIAHIRSLGKQGPYPLCTLENPDLDQLAGPLTYATEKKLPLLVLAKGDGSMKAVCEQELHFTKSSDLFRIVPRITADMRCGPTLLWISEEQANSPCTVPANLFVPQEHFPAENLLDPEIVNRCLTRLQKAEHPAILYCTGQTDLHCVASLRTLAQSFGAPLLSSSREVCDKNDLVLCCGRSLDNAELQKKSGLSIIQIVDHPDQLQDTQSTILMGCMTSILKQLCQGLPPAPNFPAVFCASQELAKRVLPTAIPQTWVRSGWEIAAATGAKEANPEQEISCLVNEETLLYCANDLRYLKTCPEPISVIVSRQASSQVDLLAYCRSLGIECRNSITAENATAQVTIIPEPEPPARAIALDLS